MKVHGDKGSLIASVKCLVMGLIMIWGQKDTSMRVYVKMSVLEHVYREKSRGK